MNFGLIRGNFGLMINETKKRDASPLDHLGRPGMARRISEVSTGGISVDSQAPIKGVSSHRKRAVEVVREPGDQSQSKRGRPKTGTKPWEALGISKATYFRQKKEPTK